MDMALDFQKAMNAGNYLFNIILASELIGADKLIVVE